MVFSCRLVSEIFTVAEVNETCIVGEVEPLLLISYVMGRREPKDGFCAKNTVPKHLVRKYCTWKHIYGL